MHSLEEVSTLISSGKKLLLAGDESLLRALPRGQWIAGTIPYFMTEQGGKFSLDLIAATELPPYVTNVSVKTYTAENIDHVHSDATNNGFSVIILPANSDVHFTFSLTAPYCFDFASRPLVGWVSGVNLDAIGQVQAKVFDGTTGKVWTDRAVVMNVTLPEEKLAEIGIVNIFSPSSGDVLTFNNDGFDFLEVNVNGKQELFSKYLKDKNIDTRLPLVADQFGMMVNTSFQSVDEQTGKVRLYAPLFKGIEYRQARAVGEYVEHFMHQMETVTDTADIVFSCNCILNYLYAKLEGKKTDEMVGPITFGEVGYQLLNQTFVYLTISQAKRIS